jgi:hypothetical protein
MAFEIASMGASFEEFSNCDINTYVARADELFQRKRQRIQQYKQQLYLHLNLPNYTRIWPNAMPEHLVFQPR